MIKNITTTTYLSVLIVEPVKLSMFTKLFV